MTIIFEADSRFNAKPGIHRGPAMTRVWWLWFAVGWLHIPFERFVMTSYDWTLE